MSRNRTDAVLDAFWGRLDGAARAAFSEVFKDKLAELETAIVVAYDDWQDFEGVFARDEESATVVGSLFNVVARLTVSANLLTLGQLAVSGASFRQAQEALATAFLLADFQAPHRTHFLEGRFPVHRAVTMLRRQASRDRTLNVQAIDVLSRSHSFYNNYSHPTVLAMSDTIGLGGAGHHVGASFDPKKASFYDKELESRIGFAKLLPNAMNGVSSRMLIWPQFRDLNHDHNV